MNLPIFQLLLNKHLEPTKRTMTKWDYIDSELLSDLVSNSLKKYPENIKPDRLDWNSWSLQEMESWKTKTWIKKEWRIIIGVNDSKELIIEDWRHLLEAYRRNHKDIHIKNIGFSSVEAMNLFSKNSQ